MIIVQIAVIQDMWIVIVGQMKKTLVVGVGELEKEVVGAEVKGSIGDLRLQEIQF